MSCNVIRTSPEEAMYLNILPILSVRRDSSSGKIKEG